MLHSSWPYILGILALLVLLTLSAPLLFKPRHDASCDAAYGDHPFIPQDLKSVFHTNSINRGEQRRGE